MADTEGHIGTLLANLQSMRHLTTLELRLLQIQDEYQLLREFANSSSNKNTPNNMNVLIDHLKDQLVINRVPIPDPLSLDTQQTAFGLELLTKQFEELVAQLKQSPPDTPEQATIIKRLDELIFTEASASSVCSLGVLDLAMEAMEAPVLGANAKQWLRLLTVLTTFNAGRTHPKKENIITLAVQFAVGREVAMQEYGIWILANFSDAPTPQEQALLGQKVLVSLVPILKAPKSNLLLHHALRCLTNLATDAANRKVIDAWFGVDLISVHLDSGVEAIQLQSLWCLSHLASEQLVPSFEKSTQLVKRICALVKTRSASTASSSASATVGGVVGVPTNASSSSLSSISSSSTAASIGNATASNINGESSNSSSNVSSSIMASAWRFIANLVSVPSLRSLIIAQGVFDYAQQVIVSELDEIDTDQEHDLSMLQEAVACAASFIAREESLRDAVSSPLLHNFLRLMGCNSAATRAQAAWALAYMSTSDKNHSRILAEGGMELALDMLDGEEQEQHAAAWLICNLAANPELHDRLRDNGALISLVKLLFSKSQDVRLVAGKALSRLSATNKNKAIVRQLFSTLSLKDDVLSGKSSASLGSQ
jgi:hypothetical protein